MSLIAAMMALSVTTTLIALGVAAWVRRRAGALRLVQTPNHRSSHDQPTPNGGGLGIVVAGSLSGGGLAILHGWLLGGLVLWLGAFLAVVGLRDDIQHLPARMRLGAQLAVCVALLFALGDVPGVSFAGMRGFELDGWVLSALLLLAGVWWINLFNFMDGIDGIAGSQAIFMLLVGAALVAWSNPGSMSSPVWMLMLCVAAATLGFLLLNWPPARIFMGDVGSTWLAYIVFSLALLSVQAGWLSYAAWLVLAAVFVTDATVTLVTRIACGERWYEAHRSHAYQKLARRWGSHRSVTWLVIGINLTWLLPLAMACGLWPELALGWVLLAYAPLVVGAWMLGAGRPGPA